MNFKHLNLIENLSSFLTQRWLYKAQLTACLWHVMWCRGLDVRLEVTRRERNQNRKYKKRHTKEGKLWSKRETNPIRKKHKISNKGRKPSERQKAHSDAEMHTETMNYKLRQPSAVTSGVKFNTAVSVVNVMFNTCFQDNKIGWTESRECTTFTLLTKRGVLFRGQSSQRPFPPQFTAVSQWSAVWSVTALNTCCGYVSHSCSLIGSYATSCNSLPNLIYCIYNYNAKGRICRLKLFCIYWC